MLIVCGNQTAAAQTAPLVPKQNAVAKSATPQPDSDQQRIGEILEQLQSVNSQLEALNEKLLKTQNKTVIIGQINKEFSQKILDLVPTDNVNIVLSSPGGDAHFAMRAAMLIDESSHNIEIFKQCSSACAEYLLPAAASVRFIGRPLIAFHGNPIANQAFVKQERGQSEEACMPDMNHAERLKAIYDKHGINFDFWKIQYEHLGIESMKFTDKTPSLNPEVEKMIAQANLDLPELVRPCTEVKINTVNKLWFPTSKQLREEFGLKFTGAVCADTPACYEPRLQKLGKPGDSFAVGNTVVVVK